MGIHGTKGLPKIVFTFMILLSICVLIYLKGEAEEEKSPKKATFVLNNIERGFYNE